MLGTRPASPFHLPHPPSRQLLALAEAPHSKWLVVPSHPIGRLFDALNVRGSEDSQDVRLIKCGLCTKPGAGGNWRWGGSCYMTRTCSPDSFHWAPPGP